MTRAPFRLFRTGLIGSVIVALAAGGHLAGGGQLPGPGILAAVCAVALVPVAVLTRFRLSFPVLAGLLGVGQLWLHWSFDVLSAAVPVRIPAGMSGHAHAVSGLAPGLAGQAMAPGSLDASFDAAMAGPGAGMDAAMVAAHAVATLLTSLLLARGERALSALASWLRPLVDLPAPVTIVPARVPGPCTVHLILPLERPGRRLPTRRGPPAPVPAA